MKKITCLLICYILPLFYISAGNWDVDTKTIISLKAPGNPAIIYELQENSNGFLTAKEKVPIQIKREVIENESSQQIKVTLTAEETVYYNYEEISILSESRHIDNMFYMPGFWYRHNLRSPQEAPSFHTSDSWQVREDRLSTPLTGIYDTTTGNYWTVMRTDKLDKEALTTHSEGEVILSGETSLGFTGFRNINGNSSLVYGFPYHEAPQSYRRKLTLAPEVKAFEKLNKGESKVLTWELKKGNSTTYSDFIADVWHHSYNLLKPQIVTGVVSEEEAKTTLTQFFKQSYVDKYDLKYFSGVHMRVDDCKSNGMAEIGFIGRILLNAFNALEYGEENNDTQLIEYANSIFDSYLQHGFSSSGFFREFVNFDDNTETDIYSIRRQSEAIFAILFYLDYENQKGRKHPEWEIKIKQLLANFSRLQNPDGSFPRKFNDSFDIKDSSGGSTPSATLPLVMAYQYFNNKSYLASAKKTAIYLEKEIISKADYFSSTLDANCEDKEASLYASTAMYYLALVTKGKEKEHYIDLCLQSAYFALSWYYLWDVPFAQGQMLGDAGLRSRGWGNVSVENNHIDVFIFEFASVLDWLAQERKKTEFAEFSAVIRTSMLQLLPKENQMFNIGRVGYYPEVVQHTNWDYGRNGKGFYNDIFVPGWTVASLWQMLSPKRVPGYFKKK